MRSAYADCSWFSAESQRGAAIEQALDPFWTRRDCILTKLDNEAPSRGHCCARWADPSPPAAGLHYRRPAWCRRYASAQHAVYLVDRALRGRSPPPAFALSPEDWPLAAGVEAERADQPPQDRRAPQCQLIRLPGCSASLFRPLIQCVEQPQMACCRVARACHAPAVRRSSSTHAASCSPTMRHAPCSTGRQIGQGRLLPCRSTAQRLAGPGRASRRAGPVRGGADLRHADFRQRSTLPFAPGTAATRSVADSSPGYPAREIYALLKTHAAAGPFDAILSAIRLARA